jgi:hypothetical protein
MAKKMNAGKNKIVAILVLVLPAFLLVFLSTRGCNHNFEELPDYGKAIDYTFKSIDGKNYSSSDFENEIVIISTLQETCPDSCAISFWHVDQSIYQKIRKNKKKKLKQVKLISYVTDINGEPVKDLSRAYAALKDQVVEYDSTIWILASGNPEEVYNFEYNDQTLLTKGDQYFAGEAYLELMLLLDKTNHLRMVSRATTEGDIRRMFQHVALLQKQYDKFRKEQELAK